MLKFATDGYALTNSDGAVQGCIKLMEVDDNWKPIPSKYSILAKKFRSEICVFHFKGVYVC